jgi:sugar phosphate isomerase/epimerase
MSMRLAGMNDEPSPDWDLHIGLDALGRIPTRYVELRAVDGKNVSRMSDAAYSEAIEQIRQRDFEVVALAADLGKAPLDEGGLDAQMALLETLLGRAAEAGTTLIRTMGFHRRDQMSESTWKTRSIEWLGRLARRADEAGLTLMLENAPDATQFSHSPSGCREILDAVECPGLKLLFDPASFFNMGHDPLAALSQLRDDIVHVHVRDLHRRGDDQTYCPPGQGACSIGQCLVSLAEIGYDGCLSLEPHMRNYESNHYSGFEEYISAGKALVELAEKLQIDLQR